MIDISLIVCTRNRADGLARMLGTLEQIQFAGRWEVVLVDNASTNHTAKVLRDCADNSRVEVCLAFESRPGLAAARNCEIRNSRGALLAFTDDDCYPEPDFLTRIAERLSDPDLAYCGGQVLLFDPTDRPITIQTRTEPRLIPSGEFLRSGLVHGANMAFRRGPLLAARAFDERLGAGTFFKSGEDTDLLRRLAWSGARGYYDPRIRVYHHHGRKTIQQEKALIRGYERGKAAVFAKFSLYRPTRGMALRRFYWYLRRERLPEALGLLAFALESLRAGAISLPSARGITLPTFVLIASLRLDATPATVSPIHTQPHKHIPTALTPLDLPALNRPPPAFDATALSTLASAV